MVCVYIYMCVCVVFMCVCVVFVCVRGGSVLLEIKSRASQDLCYARSYQ